MKNENHKNYGPKRTSKNSKGWISMKIRKLRHEGHPQKQAVAIAHEMTSMAHKHKKKM